MPSEKHMFNSYSKARAGGSGPGSLGGYCVGNVMIAQDALSL